MHNKLQNVLITGASGGIGLELAKVFAQNNYNLILIARNEAKLNEIAADLSEKYHINTTVITKDLSDPKGSSEIFEEVKNKGLAVDILVNNAGFATSGAFYKLPIQDELNEIQLNITSLVELTHLFLPQMVDRKFGKILNVASTASFQPGPFMATYYATKSFVLSFSTAIASELNNTGVSVTTLCPGPTETNFDKRAGVSDLPLFNMRNSTAESVAKAGYDALMKNKLVIIPGFRNRFLAFASKFIPRKLGLNVVRKLQEKN